MNRPAAVAVWWSVPDPRVTTEEVTALLTDAGFHPLRVAPPAAAYTIWLGVGGDIDGTVVTTPDGRRWKIAADKPKKAKIRMQRSLWVHQIRTDGRKHGPVMPAGVWFWDDRAKFTVAQHPPVEVRDAVGKALAGYVTQWHAQCVYIRPVRMKAILDDALAQVAAVPSGVPGLWYVPGQYAAKVEALSHAVSWLGPGARLMSAVLPYRNSVLAEVDRAVLGHAETETRVILRAGLDVKMPGRSRMERRWLNLLDTLTAWAVLRGRAMPVAAQLLSDARARIDTVPAWDDTSRQHDMLTGPEWLARYGDPRHTVEEEGDDE